MDELLKWAEANESQVRKAGPMSPEMREKVAKALEEIDQRLARIEEQQRLAKASSGNGHGPRSLARELLG
jgi:hypothetical protein